MRNRVAHIGAAHITYKANTVCMYCVVLHFNDQLLAMPEKIGLLINATSVFFTVSSQLVQMHFCVHLH